LLANIQVEVDYKRTDTLFVQKAHIMAREFDREHSEKSELLRLKYLYC